LNLENVDAVVLCGGLGKRLRSVTGDNPKVMAAVEGRPFLDVLMEYLARQGFKRVILCTGYQADQIEAYYRQNTHGLRFEFSREEEPLGTGGAVRNARCLIQSSPFVVLNGDSFCAVNYRALGEFHQSRKALASVVVSKAEDHRDYGGIVLDETGRIVRFLEKNNPVLSGGKKTADEVSCVNAGIYCFNDEIFSFMPKARTFSLEYDFFPGLVRHLFFGFLVEEAFLDIGTPERYQQALAKMKRPV